MKYILLLTTILAGCVTTQDPTVKVVTQQVEIPVAMPCKQPIPVEPTFCFNKLTLDQDIFEKDKCLLSDRKLHMSYEIDLLAALKACK